MAETLEIGNWRVRSVVTGHLRLDGGAMFGVVPKTLWSRVAPADEQNRIPLAMRTLIAAHQPSGRIVLTDTGAGSKWLAAKAERFAIDSTPTAIDEALKDFGATVADVTDVVITHLHFDHCGGTTDWADEPGGPVKLRFPNAKHWVHRAHWEHAASPTLRDRASFIANDFAALADANVLSLVESDVATCAIDDLSWRIVHGHTPYQLLPTFRAGEGGRDLLFVGDLTPTAGHLPPAWVMGYDLQPLKALEERIAVYRDCRERGMLLAFPHDIGHGIVSLAFDGDKPGVSECVG